MRPRVNASVVQTETYIGSPAVGARCFRVRRSRSAILDRRHVFLSGFRPIGDAERVAANGERARAMREGLRIYNLFPTLAGPIAGWTAQLPRIAAMAFNAVYVNPFHYPGFSGSLYAVKDYYRLNPRFRGKAKGKDDALLSGFTDQARSHGPRVAMG